jgi:tetratricopeptide (TPR) repeat protein
MRRALAASLAAFLSGAAVTAPWLPAPAARAEEAPASDPLAAARAALEKGDYAAARDMFLGAVKADPKSVEGRRGAAEALLGLGEPEAAIEQAFAGLEATGDKDAGLWLLAARGFLLKGDRLPAEKTQEIADAYADAKAKASMALREDDSLQLARAVLAKACRLTDETERAREVLEQGLAKDPRDFDLLFEKGQLHLRAKEYELSASEFARAIDVDPRSSESWHWKGYSLLFLKNQAEACRSFVRAAVLEKAPGSRRSLQWIAKYAGDKGIPYYRDILKEAPGHAWARAYLAYYLAGAKDEAAARKEMKDAKSQAPDDVDLAAWEGLMLELLGKTDEAVAVYMRVLRRNPNTKDAYARLVDMSTNPGARTETKDRLAIIDFLGEVRPDEGVFWNNVGLLHRDTTKQYKLSLAAYLKAAALSPEDQGIQNDTGLIYLYHGKSIGENPKKGLPFFEATLALVDEAGQDPEMGYRDALENLAAYYGPEPLGVEENPERALEYARRRNDPDLLSRLPAAIAQPSGRASNIISWAEKRLKR